MQGKDLSNCQALRWKSALDCVREEVIGGLLLRCFPEDLLCKDLSSRVLAAKSRAKMAAAGLFKNMSTSGRFSRMSARLGVTWFEFNIQIQLPKQELERFASFKVKQSLR